MFSSSPLWIGDMRKTPCVKIKPVQSRIFHLLQLNKVELSPTVVDKKVLPLENKGSSDGRDWDNDHRSATMGGGTEQLRAADWRALCPGGTAPAGAGVSARFIESARTQERLAVGGRGGRPHPLWSPTFVRAGAVGRRCGAERSTCIRGRAAGR